MPPKRRRKKAKSKSKRKSSPAKKEQEPEQQSTSKDKDSKEVGVDKKEEVLASSDEEEKDEEEEEEKPIVKEEDEDEIPLDLDTAECEVQEPVSIRKRPESSLSTRIRSSHLYCSLCEMYQSCKHGRGKSQYSSFINEHKCTSKVKDLKFLIPLAMKLVDKGRLTPSNLEQEIVLWRWQFIKTTAELYSVAQRDEVKRAENYNTRLIDMRKKQQDLVSKLGSDAKQITKSLILDHWKESKLCCPLCGNEFDSIALLKDHLSSAPTEPSCMTPTVRKVLATHLYCMMCSSKQKMPIDYRNCLTIDEVRVARYKMYLMRCSQALYVSGRLHKIERPLCFEVKMCSFISPMCWITNHIVPWPKKPTCMTDMGTYLYEIMTGISRHPLNHNLVVTTTVFSKALGVSLKARTPSTAGRVTIKAWESTNTVKGEQWKIISLDLCVKILTLKLNDLLAPECEKFGVKTSSVLLSELMRILLLFSMDNLLKFQPGERKAENERMRLERPLEKIEKEMSMS